MTVYEPMPRGLLHHLVQAEAYQHIHGGMLVVDLDQEVVHHVADGVDSCDQWLSSEENARLNKKEYRLPDVRDFRTFLLLFQNTEGEHRTGPQPHPSYWASSVRADAMIRALCNSMIARIEYERRGPLLVEQIEALANNDEAIFGSDRLYAWLMEAVRLMKRVGRWNTVEAPSYGLLICTNDHEKAHDCQYKELSTSVPEIVELVRFARGDVEI